MFNEIDQLTQFGFDGFDQVANLRLTKLSEVPKKPGVYIICTPESFDQVFLTKSTAGWTNGRNPSVPVETLKQQWVPGSRVLYIGKAGGTDIVSTLHSRLRAYIRHGAGSKAKHWGGRLIWQIGDSQYLLVAWKRWDSVIEPRDLEKDLLAQFKKLYGRLPLANLSN